TTSSSSWPSWQPATEYTTTSVPGERPLGGTVRLVTCGSQPANAAQYDTVCCTEARISTGPLGVSAAMPPKGTTVSSVPWMNSSDTGAPGPHTSGRPA